MARPVSYVVPPNKRNPKGKEKTIIPPPLSFQSYAKPKVSGSEYPSKTNGSTELRWMASSSAIAIADVTPSLSKVVLVMK